MKLFGNQKIPLYIKIIVGAMAALLILMLCLLSTDAGTNSDFGDHVRILDVGQSDCILITSGTQAALIDTSTGYNAGNVVRKLREYGVKNLDAMIITHPHSDHIGGAGYILSKIKVNNVVASSVAPSDDDDKQEFELFLSAVYDKNIPFYEPIPGMVVKIGNFDLTVLMSDSGADEENNRSVIIMAENNGKKFLFMGDAQSAAERKLLHDNIDVSCDVLKVGHHGSNTSSCNEFLAAAKPTYAVISVGDNNYGHPDKSVMIRLLQNGADVLRTDRSGDICFYINDGEIHLNR